MALQNGLDRRVANALDIVMPGFDPQHVNQNPDQQHAQYVPDVTARNEIEAVFDPMQSPNEPRRGNPRQGSENSIENQGNSGTQLIGYRGQIDWYVERRLIAEEQSADEGSRAGRHGYREKGVDADLRQHQFGCEQDAADRRVEGRSDARSGAGRDQGDALTGLHPDNLAECGAERGADLDNGPLTSHGGAGADRDRRGDRLHHRYDGPDYPLLVIDRVHHFGDAVPLCLRREVRDDPGNADAADDGNQDDRRTPGVEWRKDARIVDERELAEEKQVVDQPDQATEHHGAKASDHADDQREQRERQEA